MSNTFITLTIDSNELNKEALFNEVIQTLGIDYISDKKICLKDLLERESLSPTNFIDQIAIPHTQSLAIVKQFLVCVYSEKGISWDCEGNIVNYIFMIGVPKNESSSHLEILSKLAGELAEESFTREIINTKSSYETKRIIEERIE